MKTSDHYTLALKALKTIKREMSKADEKLPFLKRLRAVEELDRSGPVGVECRRIIASIV